MSKTAALFEGDKLIPACEIYIVYKNLEVLMFKRSIESKIFPGFLIGPGGHIDVDEDPLTAVIREAREESGVILHPADVKLKVLSFHHHLDRKEVWCEYLFRADIDKKQDLKDDIEGNAFWITINDLLKAENVFPPSKHYLDHILSTKSGIKFSSSKWDKLKLVEETTNQFQISI